MPAKKQRETKKVIACTCRVDNYDWIKERRLYNLPLPKDGKGESYSSVTHIAVYAHDLPVLAFTARYTREVDGAWLAANGYKVSPQPHGEKYAIFELGAATTEAELYAKSDVYVCSARWTGKIGTDFFEKTLPQCGGKSVPNIFERIRPFFANCHKIQAYNPVQMDLDTMTSQRSGGCVGSSDDLIKSHILTIRGIQVMLDCDLAMLYGVETKVLNQAVKRNIERFPSDFMFQITKSEWLEAQTSSANLKSQFVTSSWGGVRKLPYAFTEYGIAMLSGVLRSSIAVEINIRIMRVFVAMRRFTVAHEGLLQRIGAVEVKQVVMDEKLNMVLGAIKEGEFPEQKVFFEGTYYDAYSFAKKLVRKASKSIVLIDGYCDGVTLDILAQKRKGVKTTIVTHAKHPALTSTDLAKFNAQNPTLTIIASAGFHDRFLIMDDVLLYHFGASLKDLGRKCFAVTKMDATFIPSIMGQI